ncbi:hypothetical protein HispidOSU_014165 [Sigmodon hispidus]
MELREARDPTLIALQVVSCSYFEAKVMSQPAAFTTSHSIIESNVWLGWEQAGRTALPSSGKASQKLPGTPLPQLITKQTQSAVQSKHGRESERTSFVCRGRRTVEQRKKQAELSAISCFLGLAPSFLRGGSGRFVLVPSCSSAPLSGGLCRPRRNAAQGPQGTWLRAPPVDGPKLPTRVLQALLGCGRFPTVPLIRLNKTASGTPRGCIF